MKEKTRKIKNKIKRTDSKSYIFFQYFKSILFFISKNKEYP